MPRSHSFYYNTAYCFLLLIPLVGFGFYPSYFAEIGAPRDLVVHNHFSLMAVLIVVFIAQPFLFRYKRLVLHKTVGKFTYILMPPLLVSAFLMIRFSYFRFLDSSPINIDRQALLREAASYQAIAFLYTILLAAMYLLAIIHRDKVMVHARYMVAAALTMLGPTVDRIIYSIFKTPRLGGWMPIELIGTPKQTSIVLLMFSCFLKKTRRWQIPDF